MIGELGRPSIKTPEEIAKTLPSRIGDLTQRYGSGITIIGDEEYAFSTDERSSTVARTGTYVDGTQSYAFTHEEITCANGEGNHPLFERTTIDGQQQLDQIAIAGRFDTILTILDQAALPRREPSPLPSPGRKDA